METLKQLTDRWAYIQGGFTYIDGNGKCETHNSTVNLSACELMFYISSLACDIKTMKQEITRELQLPVKELAFHALPQSFLIMLDCDNEYLLSEPQTPLDAQFGSVAIALLYRDVAMACGVTSPLPDLMIQTIAEKTGRKPIID